MDKEAIQIAYNFSGIFGILAFGVVMGLKSRWTRRNKTELNQEETKQSQIEVIEKAIREGRLSNLSEAFPTGVLSKTQTAFGGILSNFATVFVSLFLVFACCAVFKLI
ncbi:MAG: hypothetical protein JXK94_11990 [Deltaproteobacteria bacterium]|nr:hypothetical protein [Deltaproteobacteria bacterium]